MKSQFLPFSLVVLACMFNALPVFGQAPGREKLVSDAWSALTLQKNADAIALAEKVIDEFGPSARRAQAKLAADAAKIPVGVVSDEIKSEIVAQGVLNDVAAAAWIRAVAAHRMKLADMARESFTETSKLTAARVWDTHGFFWAPAEFAEVCITQPEFCSAQPNEVRMALAWNAFNAGKHAQAVSHCDKLIAEFGAIAAKQHAELVKQGRDFPVGAVTERQKLETFQIGLVNDVSTAQFVRGKSLEALGQKQQALAAYREAAKLPLGRCWDNNGWFWSPAEGSSDRISVLK